MPASSDAAALAERVRVALHGRDAWDAVPVDLEAACATGGFDVKCRSLGGARGGVEALLVPRDRHFEVLVDPEPPGGWQGVEPALRQDLARHRLRFRLAHELAHSFFYTQTGAALSRHLPDSPEQEKFCDEFAHALLVPPSVANALPPRPTSVLTLQRRFDVSMEVAARAMAKAHPEAAVWLVVTSTSESEAAFVQWRSPASYRSDWANAQVLKCVVAARGCPHDAAADGGAVGRLLVRLVAERRQALVVAAT